jgi:2-polyprenyl-3-methyl-5-hydroxy-6-metoxy-1,4-benzoquinol methylase
MLKNIVQTVLRKRNLRIVRINSADSDGAAQRDDAVPVYPYLEREEFGPSNIETKLSLTEPGKEIFEYPDIVNLNNAVVNLLGGAKRICELGCGTGKFAVNAVIDDAERFVVASEFDVATHAWVKQNRQHPRVRYVLGPVDKNEVRFDVVVAIEVIEHIRDYPRFIRDCQSLSDRAIITTPNRARSKHHYHAGPPEYVKHVREWTAGEFFWVLRSFYRSVKLFGVVDDATPECRPVDVDSRLGQLIADCGDAY